MRGWKDGLGTENHHTHKMKIPTLRLIRQRQATVAIIATETGIGRMSR